MRRRFGADSSSGCWRTAGGPAARLLAAAALVSVLLAGCAGPQAAPATQSESAPATQMESTASASPGARASGPATAPVPDARQGRQARSSRVRFVPQSLSLAGGATTEVFPAATVDGELKVPERVSHVGWWDGGAYAGDPFGSTVIAGHVDSATEGVGFFAKLLRSKVGDRVTLRGDGHQAAYRVVSVQIVAKRALSSDSLAFDQSGDHRLVLITCAGRYDRSRGGYDSNLVVTAVPVGRAR